MDKKHLQYLIEKYADNTISSTEYEELMDYVQNAKSDEDLYTAMDNIWEHLDSAQPTNGSVDENLFNRITSDPRFTASSQPVTEKASWSWLRIAASILVLSFLGTGIYLFTKKSKVEPVYAEKTVSYGKSGFVKLSDGSSVWINSGSKLRYPVNFTAESRELYLDGEAYFDVAHEEDKPFIVHTGNIITRVLGTAFNIQAYGTKKLSVAVIRGKVSVNEGSQELSLLTPNRLMIYDLQNKKVTESEVKAADLTSWKEGELRLDNTDMEEAADIISRRYNVEVSFKDPELKRSRFTIAFVKGESLKKVMEIISQLNKFDYQMKEQKIIISKK